MSDASSPVPPLEARFLEPQGFVWGTFTNARGQALRWGCYSRPGADKTCVLVGGFTEFIEKYFETIQDFAARGFAVWCLDWLGQGGSARPATVPTKPRTRDYEADADDLTKFAREIITPLGPKLLVAHSMGGTIALTALARHQGVFDAAALSAPMTGLTFGPLPAWVVRLILGVAMALGHDDHFVPGGTPWKPIRALSGATSPLSHDDARCLVLQQWFIARPSLRIDEITYGWLDSALDAIAWLNEPSVLRKITIPILIGSAGREVAVDPRSHRAIAALLPDCELVEFPEARHELFMESDTFRLPWFAAIDRFIGARLSPANAAE